MIIIIIIICMYVCTKYQCFYIFLNIKFYFPSPFFPIDTFLTVNSLLSHSSCYFLHPRISRPSFYSSFKRTPYRYYLLFLSLHISASLSCIIISKLGPLNIYFDSLFVLILNIAFSLICSNILRNIFLCSRVTDFKQHLFIYY